MIGAGALHSPAVGEWRAPQLEYELLALDARRHGDDDVARVDILPGGAADPSGVQQAEEQVEHVWMCL